MWSHYGDNHKGICIELDRPTFLKENRKIIDKALLKRIQYREKENYEEPKYIDHRLMGELGKEIYLKDTFRKEHLEYLYFTKNREWESENEIRLLHFSNNLDNEYCSIKSSLVNVYLGIDFNNVYFPSLKKLCKDVDISLLKYSDGKLLPSIIHHGIKSEKLD
jgi:hypothetical protein